jgi:hypothetical protein
MDCGYWQVTLSPSAHGKTAFFVPDGKKRFTVMPMGCMNSHPAFVAMMMQPLFYMYI